jgi:hypothetical protein
MKNDGWKSMLELLDLLRGKNIEFKLDQQQPQALMVSFALVGIRVEVEFFEDELQFSVFRGTEDVLTDKKALYQLINENWK